MASNSRALARAAALLICVALAACGGRGGSATYAGAPAGHAVGLSFVIPSAASASAGTRRPSYISSLTSSIAVTVYPSTQTQPTTPTTVANVGPGLPGCVTAVTLGGTQCTVTVLSPLGSDTFYIAAYAGQNGTGTLLSQATITDAVTVGMGPLSVTLSAVTATVSGDMLGYSPSRTWTYTVSGGTSCNGYSAYGGCNLPPGYGVYSYFGYGIGYSGVPVIVGVYAEPQVTNGVTAFVSFVAVNGSSNPFQGVNTGAMGVEAQANGYLVSSYGSTSNDSFGTVPGTPMLVPNSLQLGQVWNPLANSPAAAVLGVAVVATVTAVGTVPGMAYCPNAPKQGVTVQYTVTGQNGPANKSNSTVSYVPGCGITDYIADTGSDFLLTGVSTQNLGTLNVARKTQSATILGTLRTIWQQIFVRHTK